MGRCYGDDCGGTAEYHALTGWSAGTMMLCGDCVRWERDIDGLDWVHTARPECPDTCRGPD